MTMVVKNNLGAQMALGELNKNINKAGQLLGKLSSGEKIVGAKDDASGYSISEKMREQIRSLTQDNQNVQNGSSLLRTAEGGINDIVEELRSLKELAIDSANDHNTDEDRKIIQKEFDSRMTNINDIASMTNYNGKILLDGTYMNGIDKNQTDVVPNRNISNLFGSFTDSSGSSGSSGKNTNIGITVNVDKSFSQSSKISVDFSSMAVKGSFPKVLDGEGFSILCGGCAQFINFKFDANISAGGSTYNPNVAKNMTQLNSTAQQTSVQFVIGVADVHDSSDLAQAIFDGLQVCQNQIPLTPHSLLGGSNVSPATSNSLVVNARHDFRMGRNSTNPTKFHFTTNSGGTSMDFYNGTRAFHKLLSGNDIKEQFVIEKTG